MIALLYFALKLVTSFFKSRSQLEAEKAALLQQLIVLQRKVRSRAKIPTAIVCSLSSCIAGFRRSSRP
jgi:hypothetical protein